MRVSKEAGNLKRVHAAVAAMLPGRYLLAVSGGRDSMVLLDACAAVRTDIVGVATYDHGTGEAATRAAALVVAVSTRRGLRPLARHAHDSRNGTVGVRTAEKESAVARERGARGTEASWRAERWAFLHSAAADLGARVVTAHSRDDQVETVFMRIMRDAGARGLAAMYAPSMVARPLLGVSRNDIGAYANARTLKWIEDPSNARRAHLRNRVRLELLPAIARVRADFEADLLDLSAGAAEWRRRVAVLVDGLVGVGMSPDTVVVPVTALEGLGPDELSVVLPEIAARAGITLDWRGVDRMARELMSLRPAASIPLSGGGTVNRTVSSFVFRNPTGDSRLY
ncbi:MAG: tRNA lysidine(34) synthetase TilS [Gemmatimonadetes bacterium]|nr:tRNA lysidine(34) synthetase TilS [Gemmatimonadota bacterium]